MWIVDGNVLAVEFRTVGDSHEDDRELAPRTASFDVALARGKALKESSHIVAMADRDAPTGEGFTVAYVEGGLVRGMGRLMALEAPPHDVRWLRAAVSITLSERILATYQGLDVEESMVTLGTRLDERVRATYPLVEGDYFIERTLDSDASLKVEVTRAVPGIDVFGQDREVNLTDEQRREHAQRELEDFVAYALALELAEGERWQRRIAPSSTLKVECGGACAMPLDGDDEHEFDHV